MPRLVRSVVTAVVCVALAGTAWAYVEVPYTLGKVIEESKHIVLVEVTRVQQEKGLVLFKKIKDLKGTFPGTQIKHNIGNGDRGFHPRESKNIMTWAAVGERAVFFCNDDASETCIGSYWYQCYREDQWWGMSHAEPYLLRTFCGDTDDLAKAVTEILAGKEVVVPCLVDANRARLHERKGKLQRLKASLKRIEYDAKRDFVGFGADGVDVVETKIDVLLAEGSTSWKYMPASAIDGLEDRWLKPDFDDRKWRTGKAPIGYGEDEIGNRAGTTIEEHGRPFVFRRAFNVPPALLGRKDVTFQLSVAADNCARVFLNGESILDEGDEDHEFAYWNQEIDVPANALKTGRNVLAIYVPNGGESSDLYLDAQFAAETLVSPPKAQTPKIAAKTPKSAPPGGSDDKPEPVSRTTPAADEGPTVEVAVDPKAKTILVPAKIAARKLPNLSETYPLEVIATAPPPKGRKAHETVITTDVRPSHLHAALESLGLKPGEAAQGEGGKAAGPEVTLSLQITDAAGKTKLIPIEKTLINTATGKPIAPVKWHFTGSIRKQPDPEKDETVYAADLSGTLIAIFPVTKETVFQSNLTMAEESTLKLETDKTLLPAEGVAVNLLIRVK